MLLIRFGVICFLCVACHSSNSSKNPIETLVWHDVNENGEYDSTEPLLKDWNVFLDFDGDGLLDSDEISLKTDSEGRAEFASDTSIPEGSTVKLEIKLGWAQTYPNVSSQISTQIIGGIPSTDGAWPWMVAIVSAFNSSASEGFHCGGTLIDSKWVLTAAHCVAGTAEESWKIISDNSSLDANSASTTISDIEKIFVHPGYNYSLTGRPKDDIALIKLKMPLNSPIVSLGNTSANNQVGEEELRALGWGTIVSESPIQPETLQEVPLKRLSDEDCLAALDIDEDSNEEELSRLWLCTNVPEGGFGTCFGDSGGPLVSLDQETREWKQVGITSFGSVCGSPTAPDVFTQVRTYRSWIEAHVGGSRPTDGYDTKVRGETLEFGVLPLNLKPFIKQFDATPLVGLEPLGVLFSWTLENYGNSNLDECEFILDLGDGSPKRRFKDCSEENAAFYVYKTPNIYRAVLELKLEDENITIPRDLYAIPSSETLDSSKSYVGNITSQDFYSEALDAYFDVHTISNEDASEALKLRITSNNLAPNIVAFDALSFQPIVTSKLEDLSTEIELPVDSDIFLIVISPSRQVGDYKIEFGKNQLIIPTTILKQDSTYEGVLEEGDNLGIYGNPVDHFELDSLSSQTLIKATASGSSPTISVWSGNTNNILFQVSGSAENVSRVAFDPISELTYGLTISSEIASDNEAKPYKLEILKALPESESELTSATATNGVLSEEDSVTRKGAFSDRYYFQKSSFTKNVSVRLESTEFDPFLEVLDANGTTVTTNDNSLDGINPVIGLSDVQEGSSIRVTSAKPGETGNYQITLIPVK